MPKRVMSPPLQALPSQKQRCLLLSFFFRAVFVNCLSVGKRRLCPSFIRELAASFYHTEGPVLSLLMLLYVSSTFIWLSLEDSIAVTLMKFSWPQAATTPPSPDSALSRTLVIKDLVLKTESKHSNVINYLSLKITVSLRILTLMSMIYLAA